MDSPRPPMPPVTIAVLWVAMRSPRRVAVWSMQFTPSHHVHSAVDGDVGAGDVAGFLRREEGDDCRNRPGLREPAHRDRGNDLLADFLADREHHVGLDVSRRHRVDGDALLYNV